MKLIKKVTAAVLVAAMALSLTACYNPDKSWAIKRNDSTLNIGGYIYYLYLAYDNASKEVNSDTEVMKATIDGKSAETWIREKTLDYAKANYWVDQKIAEYDIPLTDEELANAEAVTNGQWEYIGASLDSMGVSKESFTKVFSAYNIKYKKIFDKYYGEGAEKAIPKQDVLDYYSQNKYSYSYMYTSLMPTDKEGNPVELTDAEKSELTKQFEDYKLKIETGYYTIEAAAEDYKIAKNLDTAQIDSAVNDLKYQYFPSNFTTNLEEMKTNEIRIFESDGNLVLMQLRDVNKEAEKIYENLSERLKLMLEMKSEEFTEFVFVVAAKEITDLEINNAAINDIKISQFINDKNKMGIKDTLTAQDN